MFRDHLLPSPPSDPPSPIGADSPKSRVRHKSEGASPNLDRQRKLLSRLSTESEKSKMNHSSEKQSPKSSILPPPSPKISLSTILQPLRKEMLPPPSPKQEVRTIRVFLGNDKDPFGLVFMKANEPKTLSHLRQKILLELDPEDVPIEFRFTVDGAPLSLRQEHKITVDSLTDNMIRIKAYSV